MAPSRRNKSKRVRHSRKNKKGRGLRRGYVYDTQKSYDSAWRNASKYCHDAYSEPAEITNCIEDFRRENKGPLLRGLKKPTKEEKSELSGLGEVERRDELERDKSIIKLKKIRIDNFMKKEGYVQFNKDIIKYIVNNIKTVQTVSEKIKGEVIKKLNYGMGKPEAGEQVEDIHDKLFKTNTNIITDITIDNIILGSSTVYASPNTQERGATDTDYDALIINNNLETKSVIAREGNRGYEILDYYYISNNTLERIGYFENHRNRFSSLFGYSSGGGKRRRNQTKNSKKSRKTKRKSLKKRRRTRRR